MFDKDNSGTVTKSDLFDGLKEMGVVIADETKNTIEAINAKKITYEDFVRAQLKLWLVNHAWLCNDIWMHLPQSGP